MTVPVGASQGKDKTSPHGGTLSPQEMLKRMRASPGGGIIDGKDMFGERALTVVLTADFCDYLTLAGPSRFAAAVQAWHEAAHVRTVAVYPGEVMPPIGQALCQVAGLTALTVVGPNAPSHAHRVQGVDGVKGGAAGRAAPDGKSPRAPPRSAVSAKISKVMQATHHMASSFDRINAQREQRRTKAEHRRLIRARVEALEQFFLTVRPPAKLRRFVFSGMKCSDRTNAEGESTDSDDSSASDGGLAMAAGSGGVVAGLDDSATSAGAFDSLTRVPRALLVFVRRVARGLSHLDLSHCHLSKDTVTALAEVVRSIPPTAPLKEIDVTGNADQISRVALYKDVLQRHIQRRYVQTCGGACHGWWLTNMWRCRQAWETTTTHL